MLTTFSHLQSLIMYFLEKIFHGQPLSCRQIKRLFSMFLCHYFFRLWNFFRNFYSGFCNCFCSMGFERRKSTCPQKNAVSPKKSTFCRILHRTKFVVSGEEWKLKINLKQNISGRITFWVKTAKRNSFSPTTF